MLQIRKSTAFLFWRKHYKNVDIDTRSNLAHEVFEMTV